MCDKLDKAARTLLKGLAGGSDDLEVDSGGSVGVENVDFPSGCLAYPDFCFTHTGGFFSGGDGMADEAGDFELFCRLCSN